MEHLGIGEDDVGVRARPGALVGGSVTVVGRGDELGQEPAPQAAQLVVGQRLRREQEQRCVTGARRGRLGDGQLVAERFSRRGPGGYHDVTTRAERRDRARLVLPQLAHPERVETGGHP